MSNIFNMSVSVMSQIPAPDTLPVASGWFQFLSYLTWFFHLLSVGVMFGISVFSLVGLMKGRRDTGWKAFGDKMSEMLPFSIAFAVNFGVAPLLFLQVLYGNFFYTASIVIGIPWFFLFIILIASYYMAYWLVFKREISPKYKKMRLILSLLVPVFFSWIAFLLVNVNTLMMVPANWSAYFSSPQGMNLNLHERTLFPRFIFYLFLFMAIGGAFSALLFQFRKNKNIDDNDQDIHEEKDTWVKKENSDDSEPGLTFSGRVLSWFCVLTVPAFLLFLRFLENGVRASLFKSTGWLVLVLMFSLGLLFSAYFSYRERVVLSAGILFVDLILFVFIRNHIRFLYLSPFKDTLPKLAENTQYGVMFLFFLFLISGILLIVWILRKTFMEIRTS
jgi:hypothetical protein